MKVWKPLPPLPSARDSHERHGAGLLSQLACSLRPDLAGEARHWTGHEGLLALRLLFREGPNGKETAGRDSATLEWMRRHWSFCAALLPEEAGRQGRILISIASHPRARSGWSEKNREFADGSVGFNGSLSHISGPDVDSGSLQTRDPSLLTAGGTHIPRAHISRCTQHGMMDKPPGMTLGCCVNCRPMTMEKKAGHWKASE